MTESFMRDFFGMKAITGRTLRDEFAEAALVSIIPGIPADADLESATKSAAKAAYVYADAMMKERTK